MLTRIEIQETLDEIEEDSKGRIYQDPNSSDGCFYPDYVQELAETALYFMDKAERGNDEN